MRNDLVLDSEVPADIPQLGGLQDALKFYRASLAIVEQLAKVDPEEALWQRELAALAEGGQIKKWTRPAALLATTGFSES